jgi:hypothetical protein
MRASSVTFALCARATPVSVGEVVIPTTALDRARTLRDSLLFLRARAAAHLRSPE